MPVRYERDDARRRVVVTVEGAFETRDMFTVIARQRAEDTWSYGLLYDLRRMKGRPTFQELRDILSQAATPQANERRRGPVAVLATDPIVYGVACTYAALGREKLTVQVFRDVDDADRWLEAETSP
jgi:hypothetical protein